MVERQVNERLNRTLCTRQDQPNASHWHESQEHIRTGTHYINDRVIIRKKTWDVMEMEAETCQWMHMIIINVTVE
jgi:hypothetical protein